MMRFLKITLFAGLPFGLFMSILPSLMWGETMGLIFGLLTGLLFGASLAIFIIGLKTHFVQKGPDLEGERILKQGPANHVRGSEAVGGWLYLTDRRLLFRPHRFNIQRDEASFPLEEVLQAQPCLTAWVIPNGLRLVTAQRSERFVVEGRRAWSKEIARAKGR